MKTISTIALAAIVLGTSACANDAVKQRPAAEPDNTRPSTSVTWVASAVVVPAPSTNIVPPPAQSTPAADQDSTVNGAIGEISLSHAGASAPASMANVNAPGPMTQAEKDDEALYAKPPVRDPWEGFNRKVHGFNSMLDRFVLRPVAMGYDKITPAPVQSGVSSFFGNLRLPLTAVNQALQGRPSQAGQSLGRFVVNSTAGIAGVFDPATHIGMPKRDGEDFGQTLATWGWSDSRYLVVPLLGPRTVRDTVAIVGDQALSPIGQIDKSSIADKLQIMQMVDGRARMLPLDPVRKDAFDDYTFVRDAWAQRRNRQIEQDLSQNHN
ncbi:MlaA family lipoprotein [Variovorax sp. N23]|uniref:MlaA family lipoprotein n=1 Tax=Variovorax sp. N23 TaxID=2980555 RepID=UPI0021C7492F|nr:MlaA family lipoprotein [Variovorax sp. N23]MCU4118965.1 MlaA family lipoprotein [Variovorax sp. N23]